MTNRLTKFEKSPNSMFPYKLKDDSLCTELDSIHKLGLIEDLLDQYNVKDLEELDKLLTMATSYEELSKQVDCPLEVYVAIKENGIYTGIRYFNKIEFEHIEPRNISLKCYEDKIIIYWDCDEDVRKELKFSDHKKTWWLKEDKSE